MKFKYCKRCDQTLNISHFTKAKSRYDGVQSYCQECMKLYRKEHYVKNKQPYKDRARYYRKAMRAYVNEIKNVPCMDCGISYNYWVMEFDHREPSQKENAVGYFVMQGTWDALKTEIEKCDVVCANCHRERTARMLGLTPFLK